MKTIEYRTIDKSAWPRGEWDAEPDKMQWRAAERLERMETRLALARLRKVRGK